MWFFYVAIVIIGFFSPKLIDKYVSERYNGNLGPCQGYCSFRSGTQQTQNFIFRAPLTTPDFANIGAKFKILQNRKQKLRTLIKQRAADRKINFEWAKNVSFVGKYTMKREHCKIFNLWKRFDKFRKFWKKRKIIF